MSKVRRHNKKKVFWLSELQHLVLTSCVWLSRSSWSLGDSGDLHAVKRACPVQVSRLCLEWPRGVREKVTVLALRFHERTRPHLGPVSTHYPTQAVSSSWLYGQIESKFSNASEDAQEEEWAPLSGLRLTADSRQVSQSDASCLPQQYIVPSQHYG